MIVFMPAGIICIIHVYSTLIIETPFLFRTGISLVFQIDVFLKSGPMYECAVPLVEFAKDSDVIFQI